MGVAVALSLRDRGVRPLLIDRADDVGSAWRTRYDRLKLNTGRPFSHLPDRPYPKGTPMFPRRDDVVAHLERHAREDGVELLLGTEVARIDRHQEGGWCLHTTAGLIAARHVVVATGNQNVPLRPHFPGADGFTAEMLHSAEYRNADRFRGRRVLVVGSGSSGMEIAHDLAAGGAAEVWLAVRTPPNILLRSLPGGLPGDLVSLPLYRLPVRVADAIGRVARRRSIGDLSAFGLPVPAQGTFYRVKYHDQVPALVDREVLDAIRARAIEVVPTVESFDRDAVVLADGRRVHPHAVILATGYRPGLEPMVGHLGVLDEKGKPRACGGRPAADGLRFLGYDVRPSLIGYSAKRAKRIAARVVRDLRSAG